MSAWRTLDDELDRWQLAGRCATLWCRDDDACRDSPALARLLGIARAAGVPITLAVIPAMVEPDLVLALARSTIATVVQHGYAHRNYAPVGQRKRELGGDRQVAVTVAELGEGFAALRRDFEDRFAEVLVPPWNRIDTGVVAALRDAGYYGLSTFGPRAAACPSPGILQCNTHVDLVAWRHDREFIGTQEAITRLASHLRARREGAADASEPSGILTHHLVMSEDGWQFLDELMARTRARGATWLDTRGVFGASFPERVTCGRSA